MKRVYSLFLCLIMLAVLFPVQTAADDRTEVSAIVATSDISSVLVTGGDIHNPVFTVTQGTGVRFPDSMGSWSKKEGESWVQYRTGTFTPGTWRYSCQFRIDNTTVNYGDEYVLAKNPTLKVDGVYWTVNGNSQIGSNFSYNHAHSQEFTLTDNGELLFCIPSGLSIGNNYVNEPIESFSLAGYASGGTAPRTFSKTSGPDWISVSSAGLVSGTPAQAGYNSKLVVRVTDHTNDFKEVTISVGPTGLKDEDRIRVSSVTLTSNIGSILIDGAEIRHPNFVDTQGIGVRFPESMGGWYKKEGGEWVRHNSGTFTTGTWRFYGQFRLDGENGITYVLAKNPTLTVDGADWLVSTDSATGFDYSYNYAYSPEFEVTTTPISEVAVSIQEPIAGFAPSYLPEVPSGANYTYDNTGSNSYFQNGVMWRDVTDSYDIPIGTVNFEAGHVYMVRIYLQPNNGYAFTETVTGTINGQTASTRVSSNEEEKWVRLDYTFPALTADKPTITTQPKSVSVSAGDPASFTVVATGAASYQWYYMKPDESTWRIVTANGTSATYTLTAATRHNGYKYYCKVSNYYGSVNSKTVTLSVGSKPVITEQPADASVNVGDTVTFKVTATGATGYQWYYQKPGEDTWIKVTVNGTSATYSLVTATRHNGYKYYCKVSNAFGSTDSSTATLTVASKPVITTQPKSVTVSAGATATFKVAATGATSYQWYYQKPGEDTWIKVTVNGTSATYSLVTATRHNGYKYYCKVTNAIGSTDSSVATLTVTSKPVITTQPKSVSVSVGATATFKVVATGATSYQWYYQKPGEDTWIKVTVNGTSATYSLVTAARHNGYKYYCKVTNAAGSTDSSVATLTVTSKPVITTQPKSVSVSAGATATFKVVATGATSYQWYYQKPGEDTWIKVTVNGTSATYSLVTATRHNGYKYYCKVTNAAGSTDSSVATLTVTSKPVITTQPVSITVKAGKTATFKVVATGATSYQWQYKKPGESTWNDVTVNGKSATYSLTAQARHNGYVYRCLVTNDAGTVTSSTAKLTVN